METRCILVWGGCQYVDIFLSFHLGLEPLIHFLAWAPQSPQIPPCLRHPPPSYLTKFHVCLYPLGTLSQFTLGQLESSRGPISVLSVGGGGGQGAWVMGMEYVQVPRGDMGSWERDFGVLFPTSASPELAVTPNLLLFRRGLSTHN